MNIILISGDSVRTKNITLTNLHITLFAIVLLVVVSLLALGMNYLSLRYTNNINNAFLSALVTAPQQERQLEAQSHLHDDPNVMAVKLGQMQAQLLRLDALGERLAEASGVNADDFMFKDLPGQGGQHPELSAPSFSFDKFSQEIHILSHALDDRADKLGALDALLRYRRLSKSISPTGRPVNSDLSWVSSNFGYRIDPFTGKRTFHNGVDFSAKKGTPIKASAGGMVIYSDYDPVYGNMVEIDHGDDLISRYAHASKRLVSVGQVVLTGQKIAEVGNTGRSTGPHLHFEIRHKNVPKNPYRYLKKPG